ncbi:WD40-repeat-containing domain protein [Polychytrium aggregatum]|uniref:WD40-repeat-containing domain protein n=1 Tax=Polychytrium aggregatum TaxID=110093 RepID=UPI0022FEE7A4|nr:WD40-repeat-containing domain protein [Polychytrium aggregatum]KAI9207832.1 WD40-repeat-containing domain protein [Polychytrium aggregatum]
MTSAQDLEIRQNSPTDGISSLIFSPTDPNLLLVASWDKLVRLYDASTGDMLTHYSHRGPVLDVAFSQGSDVFSGGLDRVLKMKDIQSPTEKVLGSHEDAIRCVHFSKATGNVITGSWDKSVALWDPRSETAKIASYDQSQTVYSLDSCEHNLVVALANRIVHIYDLRNMSEPAQVRESSLKYMTRVVRCSPDGKGYAISSIEGRVGLEFFDPSPEVQAKKYAFKCHRKVENGVEYVYPVHALAYHPVYGTFASGGGDHVVNIWDGANRKRLRQYASPYETSIAALSFNSTGTMLAVAASYTFEEGEKDHPPDKIFIRTLLEGEARPKNFQ